MEDGITPLSEEGLDGVVGGAFNQKAADSLGLDVLQSGSGKQGLYVELTFSQGSRHDQSGNITENALRNMVAKHSDIRVSARTTSGEMKSLSSKELSSLLS